MVMKRKGEFTCAREYEKRTGKKDVLAHYLVTAFMDAGDFESAAQLRDELEDEVKLLKMQKEKSHGS